LFQPENNSLIHGYIQWQAETPQTGHSMRTPNMNSIKQTVRLVFYVAVPGLYLIASGKKFSGLALLFVPGMLALFALAYEFEKDLFYFLYMEVGNVLIWVISCPENTVVHDMTAIVTGLKSTCFMRIRRGDLLANPKPTRPEIRKTSHTMIRSTLQM